MSITLQIENLSVARAGRMVASIRSVQARAGEFIAVIGPNGAGKSSLLKAITGEWPATGELCLLGQPLRQWRRPVLARRLAVLPQHSQLAFDFTVQEVVALGRLPHRGEGVAAADQAVQGALQALGLESFRHRRFLRLSGGERQRVQFARVLAQIWQEEQPRLLLLDEPTSALDLAQQKSVLDHAHREACAGATVVAVMHDLNMVSRYADRVWVLAGGQMVDDTCPDRFMTTDSIQSVFGLKANVETSQTDRLPVVLMQPPGQRKSTPELEAIAP